MPAKDEIWTDEYEHRAVHRFFDKVDLGESDDSCWLWRGGLNNYGYGVFTHKFLGPPGNLKTHRTRSLGAHQYSYFVFNRQMSGMGTDMVVDHLCKVRHCVNPTHLRMVENWVNSSTGEEAECKRGHLRENHGYRYELSFHGCVLCDDIKTERRAGYAKKVRRRVRENGKWVPSSG